MQDDVQIHGPVCRNNAGFRFCLGAGLPLKVRNGENGSKGGWQPERAGDQVSPRAGRCCLLGRLGKLRLKAQFRPVISESPKYALPSKCIWRHKRRNRRRQLPGFPDRKTESGTWWKWESRWLTRKCPVKPCHREALADTDSTCNRHCLSRDKWGKLDYGEKNFRLGT